MKIIRKAGDTSNILQVFIQDSSSTVGAGLTGLAFGTSGLTAYYHKDTDTTATVISLVTMTVGTFTSLGFKEIDATNMPGWYQFCPPDAALSASGTPKSVGFHLKGASNMAPLAIEVQLVSVDVQDATAFGLSRIDGTITSRMATYTQPTGFLAATFPSGTIANTTNLTAGTIATVTNQLTAAQIATGIWQDTTAGDFTTALSVGKSVMNGVALGTGLTVNAVTGLTASNLDATISSRMATYTQPTGFLAATFPSGTVANTTNITSITGNITGNLSGSVGSVTARVTANTDQFNGDATGAANIAFTTHAIVRATASGVPTTTSIPTSACTPAGAVADQFKGRIITFDANTTSTALRGQATDITASSNSATPTFTVTALTTAPAAGDTFSIT